METNKHHIWQTRREMNARPLTRTLRAARFMVHNVFTDAHIELHANVPPPPRPEPQLIRIILERVEALPPDLPSLDGFDNIIEYLSHLGNGRLYPQARPIAINLQQQREYL